MDDAGIFTIGHSNRPFPDFMSLLTEQEVTLLIDVRSVPKSRANPQFQGNALARELGKFGIKYKYQPELGGFRRAALDSPNKAWRNTSFRGYADYMQTEEFNKGLESLIDLSSRDRLAIMCAEAVPWRCHRSLIADALVARGHAVEEIISKHSVRPHKLTSFAQIHADGHITYPGPT